MNVLINDEILKVLQVRRLPARLTAQQAAVLLGFEPVCIPILTAKKLLRPLGRPAPNAIRYYASKEVEQLSADANWLGKATQTIAEHWQTRNKRLSTNRNDSSVTDFAEEPHAGLNAQKGAI